MSRRELREQIFKLLFRIEFYPEQEIPDQMELFFDAVDYQGEEKDTAYISEKFKEAARHMKEIDAMLIEKAKDWDIERMGKAELAILRLALFEMKFDDEVPVKVAINEAVELAKRFGQDSAAAFVNGVLAKFV